MELVAIRQLIHEVRGVKVILDRDLAELYQVTTANLNKAVKRNIGRFPLDFMFQLTEDEWACLRFQNGIIKKGRGEHTKYLPYAFTEQGVAMLSGVLRSDVAVNVNIAIMRTFVAIRRNMLPVGNERIEQLSEDVRQLRAYVEDILTDQNDINADTAMQLELINEAIARLTASPSGAARPKIGFV